MSESDLARIGREIISSGKLRDLRERVGLSRSMMAELLHVSAYTYSSWEAARPVRPWAEKAERVARFVHAVEAELLLLEEMGINLKNLIPFHLATTLLGTPQETLLGKYRAGQLPAVDAGILGLWIHPGDLG